MTAAAVTIMTCLLFTGTCDTDETIADCHGCGRAVRRGYAGHTPRAGVTRLLCIECDPAHLGVTPIERAFSEALRALGIGRPE